MRTRSILAVVFLLPLFVGYTAQAQAPDVVYEVWGLDGNGYTAHMINPASWSDSASSSSGSASWDSAISGSVSGNSMQLTTSSHVSGTAGVSSISPQGSHSFYVYVKGRGTTILSASSSMSLSASGTGTLESSYGGIPWDHSFEQINFSSGGTDSSSPTSDQVTTSNIGCTGGSSKTFTEYPGTTYYLAKDWTAGTRSYSKLGVGASGAVSTSGTTTISVARGGETPVALIGDPKQNGQPIEYPVLGTATSLENLSYDPDDNQGTTARAGICSASWVVTFPDGSTQNSSSLTSVSVTPTIAGLYSVLITVTDAEGISSQTTKTFVVAPRLNHPGDEPTKTDFDNGSCGASTAIPKAGGSGMSLAVNGGTGNMFLNWPDPVSTRGYPLKNDITVNSQTSFPNRVTNIGNASFGYGIEVRRETVTRDGSTTEHWFVIDSIGTEIDFGPTSSPPAGTPGVYSTLSADQNGYTLNGAGAPGAVYVAGNYTYEFNADGQLTELTDPAGNSQQLSYDGNGDLESVTDVNTNRSITFEYDTPGFIARVVEGNGDAVTHLGYTNGKLSSITLKNSLNETIRKLTLSYNASGLPGTIVQDDDSATTVTISYVDSGNGVMLANASWTGGGTNLNYFVAPSTDLPPRG